MKSKVELWNALPQAKRMQLASLYNIKWFGTTTEQLEWDLENKLPKNILVEPVVEIPKVKPRTEAKIIDVASEGQKIMTEEEIKEKQKEIKERQPKKKTKKVKK